MKRPTKIVKAVKAPPQLLTQWIDEAADLLEQGWCQRNLALDKNDTPIGFTNALACRFCCHGAVLRVLLRAMAGGGFGNTVEEQMIAEIEQDLGQSMMVWNDDPGRTQQDVVLAFRFTAQRLRTSVEVLLKEAV